MYIEKKRDPEKINKRSYAAKNTADSLGKNYFFYPSI